MQPLVFLFALLSTVGIGAFTVVKVARLFAGRREVSSEVSARLDELEQGYHSLQRELAETQERLDFAERLLSTPKKS